MERVYEDGELIAKECSKCHQIKPIDNFYKNTKYKDNHVNRCKDCYKKVYKKKKKQKYKENIERIIKEICHEI